MKVVNNIHGNQIGRRGFSSTLISCNRSALLAVLHCDHIFGSLVMETNLTDEDDNIIRYSVTGRAEHE